ncbi:precorrin-3B C(17)-methyltransferase [Azorhizobium oxalatiphilum]|uniref:Precorrin-3B C(17)-methyltransferase n=1 Tax=Azorhizobium oxalatiphilum TaxID=980631 RepID=A0A917BHW6_9HYPH|nr:precorrin-3B C(17)-methyltransferase [Azorhizobium oxalatiphilum]GGF46102.1 precorrin-3B C(17)-methyltransferase [Azorhizobium oxalatiphilum]
MSGSLVVVGLGPGAEAQMTPQALAAVEAADELFGYGPYLARAPERDGQIRHASDNREELDRATLALQRAVAGARVAVVSGGDAGVFAMAAAVCEAMEKGPENFRAVDFSVVPGVTAMLAVAARVGAPLGHDFCAISLSDNLKPWPLLEKRLKAAAEAGFVIALYNPISKARPWQLGAAFELLRTVLPVSVPVIFGRAAGRADERITFATLGEADAGIADMATCVIIGSAETRTIARPGLEPLVYSPRSAR